MGCPCGIVYSYKCCKNINYFNYSCMHWHLDSAKEQEYNSSDYDDPTDKFEKLNFCITFSSDEWDSIKPRKKKYNEKRGIREYDILTPFTWSNVIQEHFFLHSRLPCALSFKKAQITVTGKFYITVRGRCVDCGSIFDGIVEDIPCENSR